MPFETIRYLPVQIDRFVDQYPPGIIECHFEDARGRTHTIVDKFPYFTDQDLWQDSSYPQPGLLQCQVLHRSTDPRGRAVAQVSIEEPHHIETTEGLSTFTVLADQLIEQANDPPPRSAR